MLSKINEWYNDLRETWGLELLEEDSIDEMEDLVRNDFEFKEYDSGRDKECVDRAVEIMAEEYKDSFAVIGIISTTSSNLPNRTASTSAW